MKNCAVTCIKVLQEVAFPVEPSRDPLSSYNVLSMWKVQKFNLLSLDLFKQCWGQTDVVAMSVFFMSAGWASIINLIDRPAMLSHDLALHKVELHLCQWYMIYCPSDEFITFSWRDRHITRNSSSSEGIVYVLHWRCHYVLRCTVPMYPGEIVVWQNDLNSWG